jgi:hypothetical protein
VFARAALVLLAASGCRQLLGFEQPIATSDASAPPVDTLADGPEVPVADGPSISDAPGDAFDPTSCPATYTLAFGNSRYRNIPTTFPNWLSAVDACTNDGAGMHLVVLGDAAEYAAILDFANGVTKWIGLSDRVVQGNFLHVTDEQTTFPPTSGPPWGPNEPSNGCVAITSAGTLDATACGQNFSAICECDGIPNDPANY